MLEFAVEYSDEIEKQSITVDDIAAKLAEEYEKLQNQYQRAVKAYTVLGDENMLLQAQEIQNNMNRLGREIEIEKRIFKKGLKIFYLPILDLHCVTCDFIRAF